MAISNPADWREAYLTQGPKYSKILEMIAAINAGVPGSHASSHQDGGGDEISVAALSGLLADAQTPLAHKTSHQNAGADEIDVGGLSGDLADLQDPKLHASAHEPGGGDTMAVDAAVATGSLRTIGTGALQSAPGTVDAAVGVGSVRTIGGGALQASAGNHSHADSEWPQYLWIEGNPWVFSEDYDIGAFDNARFGGGFAQLFGDGSWIDGNNFYARAYIPIPLGMKFRLVQLFSVAYIDGSTLYWDRIRLAYAYYNTSTNTRTTGNYFSDVANPYGTSNGIFEHSTSFTGPWMNGYNQGPADIHLETTLILGVQDTSSSAGDVIQLYNWAVKAEYADI